MADQILPKEFTKGGGNPADEIRKVLERFDRRFHRDNARYVERYLESETCLLAHFSVEGLGIELVAHFQRRQPSGWLEDNRRDFGASSQDFFDLTVKPGGNVNPEMERACLNKQFVLFDVVKFAQLPESVAPPAFVRLGCVDCIYHLLPNALYYGAASGWVIRGAPRNWEVYGPLRLRAAAGVQNELVGDMVERISKVLQYVGGNGCQCRWDGGHFSEVVSALAGLRIVFGAESIWAGFAEGIEPKLKVSDVLFGPWDFRLDTLNDPA